MYSRLETHKLVSKVHLQLVLSYINHVIVRARRFAVISCRNAAGLE